MFQNALLVAIEGVDGAGKNTLTSAVAASLGNAGVRVSRIAFPRYGTLYADLVSAALHGQMGDLVESAYAMATLFALDRKGALHPGVGLAALTEAAREEATNQPHIILMDRWVASNAAYSAARIQQPIDEPGGIVEWVADLEFSCFGLPVPDLTILLDVPVSLARERAAGREASDASRTRDLYERDSSLQERTAAAYRALATSQWQGPWLTVAADVDPHAVAETLLSTLPAQ